MDDVSERDLRAVREQLGREPTTSFRVMLRCPPDGHPLVIRNHPVDADGAPFPTLYWLTCPEANAAVARIESTGAISEWNADLEGDEELAAAVAAAHAAYAEERTAIGARPGQSAPAGAVATGGVGGTRTGVKCLHAHYAYHLAGGDDPIGAWVADRVEPIHDVPDAERVAVIDQGTNSSRLLIAERRDGLLDLGRDMVITRLGEGIDATGSFADAALVRTRAALATYERRARAMRVGSVRVGATSAVRDAIDRDRFTAIVRDVFQVEPEIIEGEHEALLSMLGALTALPHVTGAISVFDIGGGSTEFIHRDAGGALTAESTQMGSVRLTERAIETDPPSPADRTRLRGVIDEILDEVATAVPGFADGPLIGVAGTATTMMAIALDLPRYDADLIHGAHLDLPTARRVRDDLAAMTTPQRAALPVMFPGRADVIVAGAEILVATLERFGFDGLTVSEHDILDGLAVELLGAR